MNSNKLALIVAYYLSRFNRGALSRLGFNSFNEAFEETAKRLTVKKNYVKLRRDEFDFIFPWRRGWQRPMDKQIVKTIELLQALNENEVFQIVYSILYDNNFKESDNAKDIIKLLNNEKERISENNRFVLRVPTGRKAEEYFIEYHKKHSEPIGGALIDTRDKGCGYDFEIKPTKSYFIEVKGLSEGSGGVLFTNKEWEVAKVAQDKYYLAIVSNINTEPEIRFIKNPASVLNPRMNIVTTIQIQWSVSSNELNL